VVGLLQVVTHTSDQTGIHAEVVRALKSRPEVPASDCRVEGGQAMTLIFRKQCAQDDIKGRYSFDWGEDDYAVIDETQGVDETQIGRIYKERGPAGVKWLWSLQVARAPPPNQGIADTLNEAKAALARRYEELKRRR
jgi:hypothetical protein